LCLVSIFVVQFGGQPQITEANIWTRTWNRVGIFWWEEDFSTRIRYAVSVL